MRWRRVVYPFWLVVAVACGDPGTGPSGVNGNVRSIELDQAGLDVDVGGSAHVRYTLLDASHNPVTPPRAPKVLLSTGDPTIALADQSGNVTGLKPGETTYLVTFGTLSASIPVTVTAPVITLASSTLTFSATSGGTNPTIQSDNVVTSGTTNPPLQVSVAYTSGSGWLGTPTIGPVGFGTAVVVAPVTGLLAAGTYKATVTVSSTVAGVVSKTIAVTFTVLPGLPVIQLTSNTMSLAGGLGATTPTVQSVNVSNATGGAVPDLQLSIAYSSGTVHWLTARVGTLLGATYVEASATPGALVAGTYTATVTVTPAVAGAAGQTLIVTLIVQDQLVLSVTGLGFQFRAGASTPVGSIFTVTNPSGAAVPDLTLGIQYGAGAAGWLSAQVTKPQGPAEVTVLATAAGLAPGTYTAQLTVIPTGADPVAAHSLPVTMTVAPGPSMVLSGNAVTLNANVGSTSGDQIVNITSGDGTPITGLVATIAYNGAATGWLTTQFDHTTAPAILEFLGQSSTLPAGTYTAIVTISSTTPGVASKSVTVTLVLGPPRTIVQLSTHQINVDAVVGGANPTIPVVAVTNDGPGTLTGLVASIRADAGVPPSWLSAALAGTTAPTNLTVSLDTRNLAAGSYTGIVDVNAPGATTRGGLFINLTMHPAPPVLTASPSAVSFTAINGGASPASQAVTITSSDPGPVTGLSVKVTYPAGQASLWLSGVTALGSGAATLTLFAETGTLPRGIYSATVTVTSSEFGAAPLIIPVTFNVLSRGPVIQLSPSALTFNAITGGSASASQTVAVTNGGGATLSGLSAAVAYDAGAANWLDIAFDQTTAPATMTLSARPGTFFPGTYTATVTVSSTVAGVGSEPIAVTFVVGQALPPLIVLSTGAVTFNADQGAASPAAQTVAVTNPRTSLLTGLQTTVTYPTGMPTGWLTAAIAPTSAPATLTLTPATSGLPVGTYTATVTVSSTHPAIFPASVTVTVVVSTPPAIVLSQSRVDFTGQATGANPPAQTFDVSDGGTLPLTGLGTSIAYLSGEPTGWLTAALGATTAPATITVSAARGTLVVGVYHATITVASSLPGIVAHTVDVTFSVTPNSATHLAALSNLNQSGTAGALVAALPSVKAENAAAAGVAGVAVTFTAAAGNGTLTGATVTTDVNGVATVGSWMLPQTPGTYTVAATAPGLNTITFIVTATAGPAATLVKISGDAQTGAPGAALSQPLVVEVRDQFGNPVSATSTVTWTASDGSLSPVSGPTTAGRAQTTWTLGTTQATPTVTATVTGLTPVTFSATSTPGPVLHLATAAATFTAASGSGTTTAQTVTVTNTGTGTLNGLSLQTSYGATQPTGWLTAALNTTTAPATLTLTANAGAAVAAPGTYTATVTVSSTVAGVVSQTVAVTLTVTASPATSLVTASNLNQPAVAGLAVAAPPSVKAINSTGGAVAGVPVTFAVAAGNGTITGATATTNASGIATVGSWVLPHTPGTYTLTATAPGLNTLTYSAIATAGAGTALVKVSGDGQSGTGGSALLLPLVVEIRDQFGNAVTTPATVTWTATDGSLNPATGPTTAGRAQSVWTLGTTQSAPTATATVTGLPPVTFAASQTSTAPVLTLAFAGAANVALGQVTAVRATLSQPAPAGGRIVTVTSDNPATVSVANPGTITIAAGATTGTINVNGLALGSSVLRANATGLAQASLPITVFNSAISVPPTLNVPFGQTASLPINIGQAAPAGGVLVTLTSSNAAAVGLQSSTVTIPAGALAVNATLQGLMPGSSTITASSSGFAQAVSQVKTTSALNILQASANINTSFGAPIDIQFQSAGVGVAAPAPGIALSFSSDNPTCAAAKSAATIATGLVEVSDSILYGGTATLPCTTKIRASSSGVDPDSITVTVAAKPGIQNAALTVGQGLQVARTMVLGATNHGGTSVHIVSSDPSRILLSPNATTAATASIDVPVPVNGNVVPYLAAGVEGATGSSAITASAPGFTTVVVTDQVVVPAVLLLQAPTTTTTLSGNSSFGVQVGVANSGGTGLSEPQQRRAGQPALVATISNSVASVAQLIFKGRVDQNDTVSIVPGQSNSPGTAAVGGVDFDPLAAGTTVLSGTIPGFTPLARATASVVVTAPQISVPVSIVGAGLEFATNATLGTPAQPGGVVVHIASADPTHLRIAPNANTVGTASIDVTVPGGGNVVPFVLQGMDGQVGHTAVTFTAPGYTSNTVSDSVAPTGVQIVSLGGQTTPFSTPQFFTVEVGPVSATNTFASPQPIRAGGNPLTITLTNTTPTLGDLITPDSTRDVVSTVIQPTQATSASAALGFHGTSAGTAVVKATSPGLATPPGATASITVIVNTMTAGPAIVGAGLEKALNGTLSGSSHPALVVHLVSPDSDVMLLAPNATAAGHGTLDVPVASGGNVFSYVLQGVEGKTARVPLVVTAPGFQDLASSDSVTTPAFTIVSLTSPVTTFSPNLAFSVQVGVPNQGRTALDPQGLRTGAAALTVGVTSSVPAVGQLVTTATTGGAVSVAIAGAGVGQTPTGVAAGGVAFDPLIGGNTTVTASIPGYLTITNASGSGSQVPMTVNAPGITMGSANLPLGAGLVTAQVGVLATPAAGPVTVHVSTSDANVALLATNATSAGATAVDIVVPNAGNTFTYYIMGLENQAQTITLTATAPGYTDGHQAIDVRATGYDLVQLPASTTIFTADHLFSVRVGPLSASNLIVQSQAIRFGGVPRTATVTTSAPAIGPLHSTAANGTSVTTTIAVGQFQSPGTIAAGGISLTAQAVGSTVVQATIAGLTAAPAATETVVISAPTISTSSVTVGGGLQTVLGVSLGASQHGGTTVHLVSADPASVLLSKDAATAGTASLDFPLANGSNAISYFVKGVSGSVARVNVTVSAPGYTPITVADSVAQPAVAITSLSTSPSSGAANLPFQVQVGVPNQARTALTEQQVRGDLTALTATLTNTASTVAQLVTTGTTGQTVTVPVAIGQTRSPSTVALGGVAFDPLAQGSTSVHATIPGFLILPGATVAVTVGP